MFSGVKYRSSIFSLVLQALLRSSCGGVTVLQPFKEGEEGAEEVEKEKEIDRGRCGITFYCRSHSAVSAAHSSACFPEYWRPQSQPGPEFLLSAAQSAAGNLLFSPVMLRSPTSPN